jgi:hypothetical protein
MAAVSTVFVPAGLAHTYRVIEPSRYLIFFTPRMDRLIARLRSLDDRSQLRSTLAEFDTEMGNDPAPPLPSSDQVLGTCKISSWSDPIREVVVTRGIGTPIAKPRS